MHLLANGAHKAGRVVGLAQDRHHLTLYKLPAVAAERAMEPLEVQWAEAVTVLREEATLSQVAATHYRERHMTRFDKQKISAITNIFQSVASSTI